MAQLKVKASSKPSTQNAKISKGSKPTTALGRFNNTFFEGAGVNPSIGMSGMAALGLGGLYAPLNHLMPSMRQATGAVAGGVKGIVDFFKGIKNKSKTDEDPSTASGAIAKNRATEANRGIRTLTNVTKKGFADVLKAMGAGPGVVKKKKSLFEMLTDAITGKSGGSGGWSFFGGGGPFWWRLTKFLGIGYLSNHILTKVRKGLGLEADTTGGSIARGIGDTLIGNYAVKTGINAYRLKTARKLTQANTLHKAGKLTRGGLFVAKTAIKGGALLAASATSIATFGLSFLVEEAIMNWVVDPLIKRFIYNQTKSLEEPIHAVLKDKLAEEKYKKLNYKGDLLPYVDLRALSRMVERRGGVDSPVVRELHEGWGSLAYHTYQDLEARPDDKYFDYQQRAQEKELLHIKATGNNVEKFRAAENLRSLYKQVHSENRGNDRHTQDEQAQLALARKINEHPEIVDQLGAYNILRDVIGFGKHMEPQLQKAVYDNPVLYEALVSSVEGLSHQKKLVHFSNEDFPSYSEFSTDSDPEGFDNKEKYMRNFFKNLRVDIGKGSSALGSAWHTFWDGGTYYEKQYDKELIKNPKNLFELAKNLQTALDYADELGFGPVEQAWEAIPKEDRSRATYILKGSLNKDDLKDIGLTETAAGGLLSLSRNMPDQTIRLHHSGDLLEADPEYGQFANAAENLVAANNAVINQVEHPELVYSEATDLLTANNNLGLKVAELTSVLSGKQLVTINQSGNPAELNNQGPQSEFGTSSGSSLKQYVNRLEGLQANYLGQSEVMGKLSSLSLNTND